MNAALQIELQASLDEAYSLDGIAATYVPKTGTSVACTLLLDQSKSSVEVYLMADRRTEIVRVRKSEVAAVKVGQDSFTKTTDSSSWLVQSIVMEDALEFVLAIVKDV